MKLSGRPLIPLGTGQVLGDGLAGNALLGDGDMSLPNLTSGLYGIPGDVILEGQGLGARLYTRQGSRFSGGSTGGSGSGTSGLPTDPGGGGPFERERISRRRAQ